jgi:hypothetical protein
MSIVYDYSTAPLDDPFVALVERSLEISVRELRPEVAAIVSEFPICAYRSAASIYSNALTVEKLPPWLPGASFVRGAILQRTLVPIIVDTPFEHVKAQMVNDKYLLVLVRQADDSQVAGTAAPSMVSDALRRIPEKAKDEKEAAIFEKAIKEASASGYAGS